MMRHRKSYLVSRVLLLLHFVLMRVATGWAQSPVPTLINYQGRLVDASGVPLETANRDLTLQIFDAPTGGTLVYGPQSMPSTPVVNGYYNVLLGPVDQDNPPRPIESAFTGPERYLEVTAEGAVMSPRQRILSAPYAFQALYAKTADGVVAGGITAAMIANNAIGVAQIQSGAVGAEEIADGSITSLDLGENAVMRTNIADGEITTSKLDVDAIAPRALAADKVYGPANLTSVSVPDIYSSGNPGILLSETEPMLTVGTRPVLVLLNGKDGDSSLTNRAEVNSAGLRVWFTRVPEGGGPAQETTIYSADVRSRTVLVTMPTNVFLKVDRPPAGTFRYKAYLIRSEGTTEILLYNCELLAVEL